VFLKVTVLYCIVLSSGCTVCAASSVYIVIGERQTPFWTEENFTDFNPYPANVENIVSS